MAALAFGAAVLLAAGPAAAERILFLGNSFTYGFGSALQFYRNQTVVDLNGDGIGGVPALFKSFSDQMKLPYEVYLETAPGVGIDWHLANKREAILQGDWDRVVLQSYSTLDMEHPGDPALLLRSVREMAGLLRHKNPKIEIDLEATWPRADQLYQGQGRWRGRTPAAMAHDVRAGYEQAFAAIPGLHAVAPVGDSWVRAMQAGIAISNPLLASGPGQVNLWAFDHYHASIYGSYLSALVVFGSVTGRDPRLLGEAECSGYELGLSRDQVRALQDVAAAQLAQEHKLQPALPGEQPNHADPMRCAASQR